MRWRRAARRLTGASVLALALTAGCSALATSGPPRSPAGQEGRAPAPLPDTGVEPPGRAGPVLGVVGYRPATLAWLDPVTLRPLPGRRIRLPYRVSSYGWSPDRSFLVLGDADDDVLHLVDPARMRVLGRVKFGIVARAPQSIAWLGPRRLAVAAGDPWDGTHLLLVDPVARRVLSHRQLQPAWTRAAGAGDRMVLLSTFGERIGPARLLVMDDRGRVRSVRLQGIHAGFQDPPDWDRPGAYAVTRDAALAVDPAGRRAFVVAAGSQVAEVDLDSLRVTYRHLRQPISLPRRLALWMVPRAEAKLGAGTSRSACWLGGGSLAVWGMDARVLGDDPAQQRHESGPSGLKLLDTDSWTVRPVDPAATAASWQAGRLLAFGGTWDPERQRERGVGLTIYGPGDREPRHLLGNRAVDNVHLHGDLAYVELNTGGELPERAVVSLASGRVLASCKAPLPYLLLGERARDC